MKKSNKKFLTVRDVSLMALLIAVIIVQETALTSIPSFNFTHLLIAATYYLLGLPKTLIVVFIYTIIDNLIMGSFSIAYTPTIVIMWLLFPIMLHIYSKLFKNRRFGVAIVGAIHALLYSWAFVLVFTIFYQIPFMTYFIADIPYELILVITAFATIYLLLPRLTKTIYNLNKN